MASIGLFCGLLYVFLIEKTGYNNHYYLILLLSFFFSITNANKSISLDNCFGIVKSGSWIPNWQTMLFQFQIIVVYFYGGLAKLNAEWLSGRVMGVMMSQLIPGEEDHFLEIIANLVLTHGGLWFDLVIGFLLLSKKTRSWAVLVIIPFHVTNHFLFNIGVFPFMMLGATMAQRKI